MLDFNINYKEGYKMKTMNVLAIILIIIATVACSTSSAVYDDVYYSRKGNENGDQNAIATTPAQTYTATEVSNNSEYDYQTYYEEGVASQAYENVAPNYSKTETVTEPDGTTYTTTETYYDSEYASRFRRFHGSNTSFGYYDGYNAGCFDCNHTSIYMGYGYGYGWPRYGYSRYGYGYYDPFWGYDSYFYRPWGSYYGGYGYGWGMGYGSYWSGYNTGYWHGYKYGYYAGYYDDAYRPGRGSNYYYGHRGSSGGGTTVPTGDIARGDRTSATEQAPRGVRSADGATTQPVLASPRGTSASTRSEQIRGQAAGSERAERPQSQTRDRINNPESKGQVDTRQQTPRTAVRQQETRPTASERINEYRQRYDKPEGNSTQKAREQRYQRPQSYTAPNVRQPKSSNEYVRPQGVEQSRSGQKNTRSTNVRQGTPVTRQATSSPAVRSQPTQTRTNVRSQPSSQPRSPARTISSPTRSSPPPSSTPSMSSPTRSSSSGTSSSSSSRGSSSSGGGNRGGRR